MSSRVGERKKHTGWSLLALISASSAFWTATASAQFYYRPYVDRYYQSELDGYHEQGPRQYRDPSQLEGAPYASRAAVSTILGEEGFRLVGRIESREENIVATGVDASGVKMRFLIDPYAGDVIYARQMDGQPYARNFDDDRNDTDAPTIHPRQTFREAIVPPKVSPQRQPLPEPKVISAPPEVPREVQQRSASPSPSRAKLEPKPLAPRSAAPLAPARNSPPSANDASQPGKTARPPNNPTLPAPPIAAHGSAHRAIVPPPGAAPSPSKPAVAAVPPHVSEPAPSPSPQILSPQQPVSPILGSTRLEAPQAESPRSDGGAFKPSGG